MPRRRLLLLTLAAFERRRRLIRLLHVLYAEGFRLPRALVQVPEARIQLEDWSDDNFKLFTR